MNKHVHRLVFDRRRSMRVPTAEHVRSAGKAGGGESRATSPVVSTCSILLALGTSLLYTGPTMAQQRTMAAGVQRASTWSANSNFTNLPVRSTAANRTFYDQGQFTVSSDGRTMKIKQEDGKIIINWDSFNVGAGYTVNFDQPSATSTALNNIWSGDPSIILGHIKANGEVILQNRNGILFGPTARVDTGRFVATALSLARKTFEDGLRKTSTSDATFGSDAENQNGFITIERGAEIKALAGGDVIMVAPKVYNEGRIETPSGQTILAAGQKVYLYSNTSDTVQRGLVVAVDAFAGGANAPDGLNTVEQAAAGSYQVNTTGETVANGIATKINQVIAEKGTINLVGMTVRQNGVLSATTAVKGHNGAIFLQAMQSTTPAPDNKGAAIPVKMGTVDIGSGSVTSVTPDLSADTQTSSEAFYRSRINIEGKDVRIRSGAMVQAVSGNIQIRAAERAGDLKILGIGAPPDQSTLIVDSGATLTVAGLRDVALPMSRNQLVATPFQLELADSPVQREGVLYRKELLADARRHVQVANVTGFYNLIGRNAQELSTRGGNIFLGSSGSTVIADGARLDISGGSVRYQPGQIYSSILNSQGRLIALEDANADTRYSALINPDEKTSVLQTVGSYAEGADAGTLAVTGNTYYLGGKVDGSVVVGPLQRGGPSGDGYANVYPSTGSLLNDELGWSTTLKAKPWLYASLQPKAGTLALGRAIDDGNDPAGASSIHIVSGAVNEVNAVPEAGTEAAQALFNKLSSEVRLSASMVQSGGLGSLQLTTGAPIVMDADVRLNLGASGSLVARSAGQISLAGQVTAEGGKVKLASALGNVTLAPGAVIDVSGRVADERGTSGSDALNVNGGSIALTAAGSIDISGATLDVSGGLRVASNGRQEGKAGALSMNVNELPSSVVDGRKGQLKWAGASLSGYDFASGGTLSLSGLRSIGIGAIPGSDLAQWADGLVLSDNFFSSGGFGTFKLKALGDVKVFAGTQINARKQNLFAPTKSRYMKGESAVSGLQALTLADGLRSGVSIDLTAATSRNLGEVSGLKEFAKKGSTITVGQGASINAGVGGAIKMAAGLGVDVEGALVAHGGQIALSILAPRNSVSNLDPNASPNKAGYVAEEEIRLGAGGVLDVSGASKVVENQATHRRTGTVLGGGTITLGGADAGSSGSIFTDVNSVIDVSGASDTFNIGTRNAPGVVVSKGAGSVVINTADGYVLKGKLKANRPNATVSGGSFSAAVVLGSNNDLIAPNVGAIPYDANPHEILLLGTQTDVVNHAGGLKHAMYGLGLVSTEQLSTAGFDRISLTADDRISLGDGANFVRAANSGQPLLRSLAFNTRVLAATDGKTHTLQAGRVALGSANLLVAGTTSPKELAATHASNGTATLDVYAGLIELNGYLGLAGFGTSNLSATLSADQTNLARQDGEIRLIGRAFDAVPASTSTAATPARIEGQLNFDGQLNLTAGALYATTLSDFKLNGDSSNSELKVLAPAKGSTSAMPLTAFGHTTLEAKDITVDGPIYQTFGQVDITAGNKLTVGEHARVSVGGDGVIVPVGMTISGVQWVYANAGTQNGVSTITGPVRALDDVSLDKSINLNGKTISLDGKATLSANAGGDLQAWEFVPGVGGSADELNKAGYFAILPGYKYDYAPYDTEVIATQKAIGTTLTAGDQVTINTPNSTLGTGVYTLLPARYALLPGAVLVKATTLASGSSVGQAAVLDDGSQVVSGYVGSAGTAIGSNAAGTALTLIPQATLMARSKYALTSIDSYKSGTNGSDAAPASAGRIRLASDNAFNVGAHFELNGGGELDLYMGQKMAVVAKAGDAVGGYASVSVEALAASGAQRVLLGGKREGAVGASEVTAMSDEVLWATSVDTGTELVTAAKNKVQVADGVTLKNHGEADETAQSLTLKGKGVALALTDRVNTSMTRDLSDATINPSALGELAIGHGVTLSAQSVLVDATGTPALPADLSFSGTHALSLGAGKLLLGAASDDTSVLALTSGQLGTLTQIERLSLHATQSITTNGNLNVGALNASGGAMLKSLTLDAPELIGAGKAGDKVVFTAQQVNLLNSGAAASAVSAGQSSLTIVSKPTMNDRQTGGMTIGGSQDQHLAFAAVTMDTTGDVVIDGKKSTLSTQGDWTIKAARITGTNLANKTLKSGGELTVAAVGADRHTLNEQRGAGQSLSLEGTRVIQAGLIDLVSGKVNVKATGAFDEGGKLIQKDSVIFAEGATTNVSGRTVKAGTNWSVSTAGGTVTIQADAGRVILDGGIDVSAGPLLSSSDSAKSAGDVSISATGTEGQVVFGENASITGHADRDSLSGKLSIDTLTLAGAPLAGTGGSLDRVAELVNKGQMAGEVALRLRDLDQSLDTTLHAQRVNIAADKGSLTLLGNAKVDAVAPQGGVVSLSARDDVRLSDGSSITADSSRAGANGGDVLLSSVSGQVVQSATATVSAKGDDAQDGRIVLRAGIDNVALNATTVDPSKVVKVSIGNVANLNAGEVTVEAVQVFDNNTDASLFSLLAANSNSASLNKGITDRTKAFAKQQAAIATALGLNTLSLGRGHLRLGVELRSDDDINLEHDWSLEGLRFGGEPIMLTMRAAKNLNILGNVSDGFVTGGAAKGSMLNGAAASYRLVGGADLTGASPMATMASHDEGDVVIGSDTAVRTTAGSIEIAAAHDVVLQPGSDPSAPTQGTVYVAGRPIELSTKQRLASEFSEGVVPLLTHQGGRLEVKAGNDVRQPGLTQLPGNWLYHSGGFLEAGTEAWWTGFDSFKQGFGSFGGGNIRVEALGNVINAGVVAPTSSALVGEWVVDSKGRLIYGDDGMPIVNGEVAPVRVTQNGGDVTVKAGGDILGGVFVLGQGQGLLHAGGNVDIGTPFDASAPRKNLGEGQPVILGLMNGQWTVESAGDLKMGLVYNPTISSTNARAGEFASYFYTYGSDSAVNLSSAAGGISWSDAQATPMSLAADNWHNLYASADDAVIALDGDAVKMLAVAPPTVRMAAGGGDLDVSLASGLLLFPSSSGDLSLYAAGKIGVNGHISLADTDPANWPVIGHAVLSPYSDTLPNVLAYLANATVSNHSLLHQTDETPVRIFAGADLVGLNASLPKASEIEAQGTIHDATVSIQHFRETDRSLIKAGQDIEGILNSQGGASDSSAVTVSGPGQLFMEAGHNLNLNTSGGVISLGNITNNLLPDVSARLSLLAGGSKAVSLSEFQSLYLSGNPAAQSALIDYVRTVLKLDGGALSGPDGYSQALVYYAQMSAPHQVAFANKVMDQRFVDAFLAPGKPYASAWQAVAKAANVSPTDLGSNAFLRFKDDVLMSEVARLGTAATKIADSTDATVNAENRAARQVLWDELNMAVSMAGLGKGFVRTGDINVAASKVQTRAPGDKTVGGIDLFAPGGNVVVGLTANDVKGQGVVTQSGGNVRSVLQGDFQVNSQKAFVVGVGDLTIYASTGFIDSGRGSNTSVSSPPAIGKFVGDYPVYVPGATITGSGLAILPLPDGRRDGKMKLLAPVGGVVLLDTYIRAPEIEVAGPVKGGDNFKSASVTSTVAVAAPSTIGNQATAPTTAPAAGAVDAAESGRVARKSKSSLLTVELLSIGGEAPAAGNTPDDKACADKDCAKK